MVDRLDAEALWAVDPTERGWLMLLWIVATAGVLIAAALALLGFVRWMMGRVMSGEFE